MRQVHAMSTYFSLWNTMYESNNLSKIWCKPCGKLQMLPALVSCCQMESFLSKAPIELCQNYTHLLSWYDAFLWSFRAPSNGMFRWNLLHCHTEILSMRYQNLLPLHTYLPPRGDSLIWDPYEESLENEDIASPVQCQGLTSEPVCVEVFLVVGGAGIFPVNLQPNIQ